MDEISLSIIPHLQQKLDYIIYVPDVVLCKVFDIYTFLQVFSELREEIRVTYFHSNKDKTDFEYWISAFNYLQISGRRLQEICNLLVIYLKK